VIIKNFSIKRVDAGFGCCGTNHP